MKNTITYTYIVASVIALVILHNDLKDTSEALKESQNIINYHQRALESHRDVIKAHDDAIGIMFDHFSNTQV